MAVVEMLAHELEAEMRVGCIEIEAAAIELLDRFLQFAARSLTAAA
jgi:hypothetical protein